MRVLIACLLLRFVSGSPIVGLTELAARGNPLFDRLLLGFVYVKMNTDGGKLDEIINDSKEDGYLLVHRERLTSNLVSSGKECQLFSKNWVQTREDSNVKRVQVHPILAPKRSTEQERHTVLERLGYKPKETILFFGKQISAGFPLELAKEEYPLRFEISDCVPVENRGSREAADWFWWDSWKIKDISLDAPAVSDGSDTDTSTN